jgi:hypothetical protein
MRVIGLFSVVLGVSSMVLLVIPAQPGKAAQSVNSSLIRVAGVMQQEGFDVGCV